MPNHFLKLHLSEKKGRNEDFMEEQTIIIDVNKQYQTWDGFGTSLMWWANAMKGFEQIPATISGQEKGFENRYQELINLLFHPKEGLGINIVRYNVGGGDCDSLDFINRSGAKIPGYINEKGEYNWKSDEMQQKVLKDAFCMIQSTDQHFYNTVFSVSPPYFMTYSGSSTGNKTAADDNLRWDCYKDFTDYFLNVASYIHDTLHIPVTDIEPVNEPTSGYWVYGSQKQEGCQFNRIIQPEVHQNYFDPASDPYNPDSYSALSKIYEITGRELAQRQKIGKLAGVIISGTDETSIDEALLSFESLTEKAKEYISKIAVHEYMGSKRTELKELARTYKKQLWMSEVSYGGGIWNPEAMDEGCFSLCRAIQKDIYELGATGWVIWQAIEGLGENLLWNSNWGLIHCLYEEPVWKEYNPFGMSHKQYNFSKEHNLTPEDILKRGLCRGDYFLCGQYYAFGQYTKFLREGFSIVDVSSSDFVAALSLSGSLILITFNDSAKEKIHRIEIKNISKIISVHETRTSETEHWANITTAPSYGDRWIVLHQPARSVSTYEIVIQTI